jgi:hypothetical protein
LAKDSGEERSDEYLTVLDEYFSDHGQWLPFYHWFRQYVTIYKSSRWLHEDVELVLETDKSAERVSLEHTFTARLVTGFDAPPSAQALGMGRHFILRELVRFGILHSPHIYEQCFVPVARVCRLMERIGCSGGIYASLCRYLGAEKATFNGSFDLPLLFVAENEALQRRFLSGPVPPPPEGTVLIDERHLHQEPVFVIPDLALVGWSRTKEPQSWSALSMAMRSAPELIWNQCFLPWRLPTQVDGKIH